MKFSNFVSKCQIFKNCFVITPSPGVGFRTPEFRCAHNSGTTFFVFNHCLHCNSMTSSLVVGCPSTPTVLAVWEVCSPLSSSPPPPSSPLTGVGTSLCGHFGGVDLVGGFWNIQLRYPCGMFACNPPFRIFMVQPVSSSSPQGLPES